MFHQVTILGEWATLPGQFWWVEERMACCKVSTANSTSCTKFTTLGATPRFTIRSSWWDSQLILVGLHYVGLVTSRLPTWNIMCNVAKFWEQLQLYDFESTFNIGWMMWEILCYGILHLYHKVDNVYKWNKIKQLVRQAQLIFITYKATCLDLICRSSSGLHTVESSMLCMLGSHYVYINKML
jgi:hypothetical protein